MTTAAITVAVGIGLMIIAILAALIVLAIISALTEGHRLEAADEISFGPGYFRWPPA